MGSKGVQGPSLREAETMEEKAPLFALHSLLSLLSNTAQDYLPGWHLSQWVDPPTSIVNEENTPQTCPQANGGNSSIKSPSSQTPFCVKLTKN